MATSTRTVALWLGLLILAIAGVLLYDAGGMYVGVSLFGLAATGAVLLVVKRMARDW